MKQYFRVFSEKGEDFTCYWVSISTKVSSEDGDKYVSAPISARLSKDAEKVFNDNKQKTKTKNIKQCVMISNDFWLKAVQPKDEELKPFVVLFINTAEAAKEDDE